MIVCKCPLISSTQPIALVGLLGNFLTHVFITHQKQQMKCSKQLPRRIFIMVRVIIIPAMMIILVAQQLRMHKTSAEKNATRFCASSLKCDHPKSQLQIFFSASEVAWGILIPLHRANNFMPVLCFQFQQPQVSLFWRLVTIWSSQVPNPQPSCNSLPKASESVSPAKFGQRSSKVIESVVYVTSECCPMSQFIDKAKFIFLKLTGWISELPAKQFWGQSLTVSGSLSPTSHESMIFLIYQNWVRSLSSPLTQGRVTIPKQMFGPLSLIFGKSCRNSFHKSWSKSPV